MFKFKHLGALNMTYIKHLKMSMNYSFYSLKSSYYFFIHALYPDIYLQDGSKNIHNLSNVIRYNEFLQKRKLANSNFKREHCNRNSFLIQKLKEDIDSERYNNIHE